jgi:hypothetical protein
VRQIDAHSVPHLKTSKAVRAVDGADILDGLAKLENLTLRLVAAGMGVSVGYLVQARRLTPEQRQAVRDGRRPLILPRAPVKPPVVPAPVTTPATPPSPPVIAADAHRQVEALVDVFGLGVVLDWLVNMPFNGRPKISSSSETEQVAA